MTPYCCCKIHLQTSATTTEGIVHGISIMPRKTALPRILLFSRRATPIPRISWMLTVKKTNTRVWKK